MNKEQGASIAPTRRAVKRTKVAHRQYAHVVLHRLLWEKQASSRIKGNGEWIASQALHCPYYVPLEGKLGADWGVIVNPESTRYALLTFEHDDCGCPGPDEARHQGSPDQDGDMWEKGWKPSEPWE